MKVYAVLGIYDGVPTDVELYVDREMARRRGRELAKEYDVLSAPPDLASEDGSWQSDSGSARFWMHHWYSDDRDVVVATCDLRQNLSPVPVR